MQRHRHIVSAAAAVLAWVTPASAAPPESDGEPADRSVVVDAPAAATWVLIDARNHATGASGLAAVLFGTAEERGHSHQASLRVACFENVTTLHVHTAGLRARSSAVAVAYSLDGGPFRSAFWQAGADGSGLDLSGDRAVEFLTELYGKTRLRLVMVRPLSVPFLLTFAVAGAEQSLSAIADRCQWAPGPAISDAGR